METGRSHSDSTKAPEAITSYFLYIYIYIVSVIPSLDSSLHSKAGRCVSVCRSLFNRLSRFMTSRNCNISEQYSIQNHSILSCSFYSFYSFFPLTAANVLPQRIMSMPRFSGERPLSFIRSISSSGGRTSLMPEGIEMPGISNIQSLASDVFCESVGMVLSCSMGSA